MNILFCSPLTGGRGNYPVHVYEVLTNLSRLGHNIICPGKTQPWGEREAVPNPRQPSPWERAKSALGKTRTLRRLKGEVYIVWSLLREIRISISIFRTLLGQRGKIDVIYRRHGLFHSEYFLARLFGIPSVQEVNGIEIDLARVHKRGDTVSLWLIDRIERYYMSKADKIIVITPKLAEVLARDYHVAKDKIVVVPNGANTDLFKPMDTIEARRQLNLELSQHYVGMAGSFTRYQGHEYLIRSAPLVLAECPDSRFLIVGDGETREALTALAHQIECSDRIMFTGSVPYEQVPLYLNATDLCVSPKKPLLGGYSPQSLYEFMACGRPVIATRTSGFEILEEHNAGLLINPENAREFADAIIKLLRDPELRERMGENGRRYVMENHSWKIVASKVAKACQEAINEYKKPAAKGKP